MNCCVLCKGLYLCIKPSCVCHKKVEKIMEKQKVWTTLSETKGCGFFVWVIMEVQGTTDDFTPKMLEIFEPTPDGGFILINCYHFFTKEKATQFLNDASFAAYQDIEIIP